MLPLDAEEGNPLKAGHDSLEKKDAMNSGNWKIKIYTIIHHESSRRVSGKKVEDKKLLEYLVSLPGTSKTDNLNHIGKKSKSLKF